MNKRTALVTGACGGLGQAIVERLCRSGCRTLLPDVSDQVHAQAEALAAQGDINGGCFMP